MLPVLVAVAGLFVAACSASSSTATFPKSTSAAPPRSTTTPPTAAAAVTTTTATATGLAGVHDGHCASSRPLPAGLTAHTLSFLGVQRTYQLYVPASYDGTTAVPVVFNFHGFGSNAAEEMIYADFRPLATRNNFLIVAPDGQDSALGRHFNLTSEPGRQDDVAFVLAVLDHIESAGCVEYQRIYATGMSDGGAMTSVLACRASDRFAAFGPVAVVVSVPGCPLTRGVPIMAFRGTADPVVPFNGGRVNCCGGPTLGSSPAAMAGWASADGCQPQPAEQRIGTQVRLQQWTGCRPGGAVAFYIIDGGGHTWPGSAIKLGALGLTTDQVSATDTLWQFFQAHPLPA